MLVGKYPKPSKNFRGSLPIHPLPNVALAERKEYVISLWDGTHGLLFLYEKHVLDAGPGEAK